MSELQRSDAARLQEMCVAALSLVLVPDLQYAHCDDFYKGNYSLLIVEY